MDDHCETIIPYHNVWRGIKRMKILHQATLHPEATETIHLYLPICTNIRPLLIASQSDSLIQIVNINSHTEWQTVQIQISWLLRKPTDLDLHCLQRSGISGFSRTMIIFKSGHWPRRYCLKVVCFFFSIFTSGNYFVQWSGTIIAILVKGPMGNMAVK